MIDITEWEVLTPDGYKDFSGIVELEKETLTVSFRDGSKLIGSLTHRVLLKNNQMIELQNLMVGDTLIGQYGTVIIQAINNNPIQKVYDLVEVQSNGHQYFTNGIVSHNCDEMAFIPNRIQTDFMAGTAPSLSATRGKMMITSTPNGSRDLFAKLWFGSGMEWDKKEYTYTRNKNAKNDFVPLFVPYWLDADKVKPEWIKREKGTLDDPLKWKVEFECLAEETEVEVYDTIDEVYKTISLKLMNHQLIKDVVDSKFIIEEDIPLSNL